MSEFISDLSVLFCSIDPFDYCSFIIRLNIGTISPTIFFKDGWLVFCPLYYNMNSRISLLVSFKRPPGIWGGIHRIYKLGWNGVVTVLRLQTHKHILSVIYLCILNFLSVMSSVYRRYAFLLDLSLIIAYVLCYYNYYCF